MFDHHVYCLEGEQWKDVIGYEGIYQASSFGRIRTVDGKKTHSSRCGVRTWQGKILKSRGKNPVTGNRVTLWKDKKSKDALVARLVCAAFHGVPDDPKMTVNHKDGNRFNNYVDNLEWLSLADNIRHAFANDLMPSKPIIIKVLDKTYTFNSLAEASKHIGRNHGYISNRLQRSKKGTTAHGQLIEII